MQKKYQAMSHLIIVWRKRAVCMNTVCKSSRIASTLRSTLIGAKVFGTRTADKSEAHILCQMNFLQQVLFIPTYALVFKLH